MNPLRGIRSKPLTGDSGAGRSAPRILGLLCLALLFLPGQAHARDTLPVVTVEFPPFAYLDTDGQPVGANTLIVKEGLAMIGYQAVVDTLPTKRAQHQTNGGVYAALYPVTKSRTRAEYCIFSAVLMPSQ